jgi:hypothetical protein
MPFIKVEAVGVNSYPNLVGNLPVSKAALEGEQIGLDEYPLVHNTPSLANLSMFGVLKFPLDIPPP